MNIEAPSSSLRIARCKTPLFLAKTYEMISECDSDVAGWTDDGGMFVVKDQSTLARIHIPRFFTHSKFSTFDRQLNYYGFRKVFPEAVCNPKKTVTSDGSENQLFFYHENFHRDYPERISEIRRSTNTQPLPIDKQNQEVEELLQQVTTLENRINGVSLELDRKLAVLRFNFESQLHYIRKSLHDGETFEKDSVIFQDVSSPGVDGTAMQHDSTCTAPSFGTPWPPATAKGDEAIQPGDLLAEPDLSIEDSMRLNDLLSNK